MFYILIYTIFIVILKFLKYVSSLENFYEHNIHVSVCPPLPFYYVKDVSLKMYFSKDCISLSN